MPKGALLHIHLDGGTMAPARLLELAMQQPAVHIRVSNPLNTTTIGSTLPELKPLPIDQFTSCSTLTDNGYSPNTWVSLRSARENFSPSLGGPAGFDNWLTRAMSVDSSEVYGTHNTVEKVISS
jgi:adenosine deaminase CECR1